MLFSGKLPPVDARSQVHYRNGSNCLKTRAKNASRNRYRLPAIMPHDCPRLSTVRGNPDQSASKSRFSISRSGRWTCQVVNQRDVLLSEHTMSSSPRISIVRWGRSIDVLNAQILAAASRYRSQREALRLVITLRSPTLRTCKELIESVARRPSLTSYSSRVIMAADYILHMKTLYRCAGDKLKIHDSLLALMETWAAQ